MEQSPMIRRATRADAQALGVVGPAAYAESYGHMWSDASGLAKQLATFDTRSMEDFLGRADTHVWLAEQDGCVVGFLTLILDSRDPIERRAFGAEVQRIYLLGPARGAGLAAEILKIAEAFAVAEGMDHLWLDVMAEATWARQTYARWGFVEIGRSVFHGNMIERYRPMVIMRRCCSAI